MWRFNSTGRFGSGDIAPAGVEAAAWKEILNSNESLYQVKSGKLITFLYLFILVVFSISLILSIVLCSLACCCGMKNFNYSYKFGAPNQDEEQSDEDQNLRAGKSSL